MDIQQKLHHQSTTSPLVLCNYLLVGLIVSPNWILQYLQNSTDVWTDSLASEEISCCNCMILYVYSIYFIKGPLGRNTGDVKFP